MKAVFTIFLTLVVWNLFAQGEEVKREIKYTAEIGTILSSNGETPFWLRANQYGIVSLTSPIVTLRGSVSSDYKKAILKEGELKSSKFDWGYGLNVVGNVGKSTQILIPEAYIKAKYGAFEIYGGRRKEIVGLVDSTLSSGSYIWSGNALPMPKIQLSNPDFVPLGFTKGFLSFKGSYAHGWFENSRTDVKNFYLHQKSLYFRLGKPDWKFHFYGGFNHQVQWGGELLYPDPDNVLSKNGKLPSSFKDYLGVITGKSLAIEGDTTKFSQFDAGNRVGNHLGTLDIGVGFRLQNVSIIVYRQNIYEDGSLFYLNNISDGLNGVAMSINSKNIKDLQIKKVVIEYINTVSQGGNTPAGLNSRTRGEDNYFNSGQYINGWSYIGKTIGTALLLPYNELPILSSEALFFPMNRISSFYIAFNGIFKEINFKILFLKSQIFNSYGVYNSTLKNMSTYLQLSKKIYKIKGKMPVSVFFDASVDIRTNSNNNFGIYAGVKLN